MRSETIGLATVYHGDCLEILPQIGKVDVVITDPVWPNCPAGMLPGSEDKYGLFQRFFESKRFLATAGGGVVEAVRSDYYKRVVIVLGFDSDPRFLGAVPSTLPFVRSQQLPYAFPGYRGRLLAGDEVAYTFGDIPKGRGVIPGRAPAKTEPKPSTANGHPSPRQEVHMRALVGWWSLEDEIVMDPFAGSGTTGVACMQLGRPFIGIEIHDEYFQTACRRIEDAQRQERMFA